MLNELPPVHQGPSRLVLRKSDGGHHAKKPLPTTVFVGVSGRFGLLLFDLPQSCGGGEDQDLITTARRPRNEDRNDIDVVELFEFEPVDRVMG